MRSLFSGTNWLAMKLAPCGSLITASLALGASKGPETTSPPSSRTFAAVAATSLTAKSHAPARGTLGVAGADQMERIPRPH